MRQFEAQGCTERKTIRQANMATLLSQSTPAIIAFAQAERREGKPILYRRLKQRKGTGALPFWPKSASPPAETQYF